MFRLFKCKHPFRALRVAKAETVRDSEKYPGEFIEHDYYFRCADCDKLLTIGFADPVALKAQIDSTFETMGVTKEMRAVMDQEFKDREHDKQIYSRD